MPTECVAMAAAVIFILAKKHREDRKTSFFVLVSILYAYFKIVIAAYTIDSDIVILNYLYLYFYNLYFFIIIYKLANKTVQQYQQAERYQLYLTTIKATFILYSLLFTAALVYRIIKIQIRCNGKSGVT
jgi:hypothetical protein